MEIVSSSGSFLSSFLIFLLLEKHTLASGRSIYFSLAPKGLSSGLSVEQFSVIGPTEPIRAWVGRTADLPCYLSPQKNAQSMKVIWFQSLEIVHHYEDGQDKFDNQSPKFQGRTELVKDAISRGNVTLRIWNITAADKGHYKCHFDDGLYQEEAGIELLVSGEGTEQQILWWSNVTIFFSVFWIPTFIISEILFLPFRGNYKGDWGVGGQFIGQHTGYI
uniref:Myelin-oligodendrocyte glycoprotein-like n=1 Tax=Monodelphis domestica TaxID=13616 RepID=A0A5F8GYU7_MONDO